MTNATSETNLSFLYDYNDNFEYNKIDYSDWVSEPWEDAGYRGDKLVYVELSAVRRASTNYADLTVNLWTDRPLGRIRWAQNVRDLRTAAWETYTAAMSVPFDPAKAVNGQIILYCQVEDTDGNRSGVFSSSFY